MTQRDKAGACVWLLRSASATDLVPVELALYVVLVQIAHGNAAVLVVAPERSFLSILSVCPSDVLGRVHAGLSTPRVVASAPPDLSADIGGKDARKQPAKLALVRLNKLGDSTRREVDLGDFSEQLRRAARVKRTAVNSTVTMLTRGVGAVRVSRAGLRTRMVPRTAQSQLQSRRR